MVASIYGLFGAFQAYRGKPFFYPLVGRLAHDDLDQGVAVAVPAESAITTVTVAATAAPAVAPVAPTEPSIPAPPLPIVVVPALPPEAAAPPPQSPTAEQKEEA